MLRLIILTIIAILSFQPGFAQDNRPNIILIIADDMAWDDSTPYGHQTILTPNLQKLADEGMKFEKAFVTASSCSPSRASIITGQYPTTTDADELHWPVPGDRTTFVEKLKAAGYWTGAAGKWHLGAEMKSRFNQVLESAKDDTEGGSGDWLKLLEGREKEKPFFLWLAAQDPHRPYGEVTAAVPAKTDEVAIAPYHPDTPLVRQDYADYYNEIMRLDKNVGIVMSKLKEEGVDSNTMVMFISDNGRPFPRDKTTLYDSGIRTPFLVRWPEAVQAGSVCKEIVSTIDIARTCLGVARITKVPPSIKGRSLLPQLLDPEKPGREYVYAEKNWHDFEDHARAVRNKRYKYIRNYYYDLPLTPSADAVRSPTYSEMKRLGREKELLPHQLACFVAPRDKEELYDCQADPFELNNVASDPRYASVVLAMRAALKSWETTNEDAPPALRTADEFDRVTGEPTSDRISPRRSKAEMVERKLTAE